MKQKLTNAFSLALIVAMLFTSAVLADDVSNTLDATVDAAAETMPLNVGGANGSTQLYIIPANGDGKNGCNLTGSTTLSVSISSSHPSVATVSPATATFTSCGDAKTLTIMPVSQGTATISVAQTGNNTGATFNFAPATFIVNVVAPPPSNTAPTVVVAGVTGGASYNKGSVPAATCQVTDAEDGSSSFAATLSDIIGSYASDGIGSQTASCSYTDAGGLNATASETYSIVDPSAPVIGYTLSPASPNGNNDWYKGDVTLTWTVTEDQSPNSLQLTGCVDQSITADQDETSYSCSATSAGGSSETVTVSIKRDGTLPFITASRTPAANSFGWNNSDVTASYAASDATSGLASDATGSFLFDQEGANQQHTFTVSDNAGNSASATVSGVNIDKTAPTASASASPSANGFGWNNTDVTVSFNGSDGLSGIDTCSASVTLSNEGAGQSASGTCTDQAGNISALASATVNIDKTAPTISLVGGPADGGIYYFGFVPAAPTCSASDALSGLNGSCAVSGHSTAIGTHTVSATASDKAGNQASASATYEVKAWTLNGFYQPVDMTPANSPTVWNTVKNGSTVPLKFELFAGSTELTDTASVKSITSAPVACTAGSEDAIETVASNTGGTTLRYDATAGQFVFNWKTPATANKCYRVTMEALDGSKIIAFFKLK